MLGPRVGREPPMVLSCTVCGLAVINSSDELSRYSSKEETSGACRVSTDVESAAPATNFLDLDRNVLDKTSMVLCVTVCGLSMFDYISSYDVLASSNFSKDETIKQHLLQASAQMNCQETHPRMEHLALAELEHM